MKPGALCIVVFLTFLSTATAAQEIDLDTLVSRANSGDPAAQSELAQIYHAGRLVTQNFQTSAEWAKLAANAGETSAQNLLGRYFYSGLGGEKDQEQALHWLGKAAASGNPAYLYDLAHALENGADGTSDATAASKYYSKAADAGHIDAAVSLGVLYQEGRGVEQDYAKARTLYEKPASEGHARAQNNLGLLYVRGHGVPQDYQRAAELFQAAAEQGFSRAIRNLGVMYENGFGVPFDEDRAVELYRQAGMRDTGLGLVYDARLAPPPSDEDALEELQSMAGSGDPVAQFQIAWLLAGVEDAPYANRAAAARLFRDAADAGHGPSMINLGLMYFDGAGVPLDFVLGQMWLTLAASAGQKDATAISAGFSARMTADQIHEAQRLAEDRARKTP